MDHLSEASVFLLNSKRFFLHHLLLKVYTTKEQCQGHTQLKCFFLKSHQINNFKNVNTPFILSYLGYYHLLFERGPSPH